MIMKTKCSTPALGEDKNIFVRFYQNKYSKFLIIFLLKVYCKKRHRLCKNIYKKWIQKRSKNKKEKRKEKKDEKKIAHVLAKIFRKREIYFKEHSRIRLTTKYSTHMCILI
jgi:hypothetical protein